MIFYFPAIMCVGTGLRILDGGYVKTILKNGAQLGKTKTKQFLNAFSDALGILKMHDKTHKLRVITH